MVRCWLLWHQRWTWSWLQTLGVRWFVAWTDLRVDDCRQVNKTRSWSIWDGKNYTILNRRFLYVYFIHHKKKVQTDVWSLKIGAPYQPIIHKALIIDPLFQRAKPPGNLCLGLWKAEHTKNLMRFSRDPLTYLIFHVWPKQNNRAGFALDEGWICQSQWYRIRVLLQYSCDPIPYLKQAWDLPFVWPLIVEAVSPPLALWWDTVASTMWRSFLRCPAPTYVKCKRRRGLLQAFAKRAPWSPGVMQTVEGIQCKLHISWATEAKVM